MPVSDVEENIDSVALRCIVDANPAATVIWRRIGGAWSQQPPSASNIYSFQEMIEFAPVNRKDSALYSCEAKNALGTSNRVQVALDVKCKATCTIIPAETLTYYVVIISFIICLDSPSITSVGPSIGQQLTVSLYESAQLECQAEGNPVPEYRWLFRRPKDSEEIFIRSEERHLKMSNVTYENQGEYVCTATTVINGLERTVQSEPINVRVVGKLFSGNRH